MSEFDKEAERERLREKFADEEADRASARHMSELLLQGMTMTDRHCPECGAPLFRDDDRTFCPECERQVVEDQPADGSGERQPDGEQAPPTPSQPAPSPATGQDARENLQAALQRAAAGAAAASDPRTARDHLEAAKAAIEAIRAFDQQ